MEGSTPCRTPPRLITPDVLQVSHSEEGFTFSDSYAQDEPVAAVRDPPLILTTRGLSNK